MPGSRSLTALLLSAIACAAAAMLSPSSAQSQSGAPSPAARSVPSTASPSQADEPSASVSGRDRRRAEKLYLEASKLFQKEQFEPAMHAYEQASALDPTNRDYKMAALVARSHFVTALIQKAAKARLMKDAATARAALQRALELDPGNVEVAEHLHELADDVLLDESKPIYEAAASSAGEAPILAPAEGVHSFHLRTDKRQLIQSVFKSYGIDATLDQSVSAAQTKFDLDDATFAQSTQALGMSTQSFWVPIDSHRVLVARDTRENRDQFLRQNMETIYLPGLTATEMTDVGNLAKNVFDTQHAVIEPSKGTLTIRAPAATMNAFNQTLRELLDGRSQVLLEVRIIQIARTSARNTGVQLPQTITAFNVYAEEQAILNANQALVQQIISSGLAAPGDTLAILGILLASGQVTSSIFSNGIALFGGGLTLSGLSPGPVTMNLNLNSSDSRELDQAELRLGDGEEATLRSGTRYPIMTANYSSLGSGVNIPGLNTAGNSSSLSSLLSSLGSSTTQVPQVQYQDLGLTFRATPKVMRNGDVALLMDMKITALAGNSVNGVPVLNNRAYSGTVTLKAGAGVVIMSELDQTESRALSGVPGVTDIPGLNNLTSNETQKDYATLLVLITPHVIRGPQESGHSPMMRVDQHVPAP